MDRGARAVDFLLGLQLPDGAFPGGEVLENRTAPSPFNSAQILHGLTHWVRHADDPQLCGRCVENVNGAGETRRWF
mgnify:CR=1 FL=1